MVVTEQIEGKKRSMVVAEQIEEIEQIEKKKGALRLRSKSKKNGIHRTTKKWSMVVPEQIGEFEQINKKKGAWRLRSKSKKNWNKKQVGTIHRLVHLTYTSAIRQANSPNGGEVP